MNQSSVFTFNRIAITLFLLALIGFLTKVYDGVASYEELGRLVGLWLFVIIGRLIYLFCTRKTGA